MRRREFILGALSLATCAKAALPAWKTSTSILTPSNNPRDFEAFYWNSYSGSCRFAGVTMPLAPAGVWNTINLAAMGVPINANAVQLANLLVITDGANSSDADLAVAFQATGAGGDPLKYVEQAVAVGPSGGSRTNATAICPLIGGCMDVSILRGNSATEFPSAPLTAQWPQGACYAVWLLVQAVFLP